MAVKLSKEFKKAISDLPEAEKDKLLFKLLPRDKELCEKLQFELLEDGETLEERRSVIRAAIEIIATGHHYSAGWLMMDLRSVNAEIGRHSKRTNDKEGEISLTLHMLNRTFDEQSNFLQKLNTKTQNLSEYLAKRTHDALEKLKKLHPDLHVEFEDDFNKLLSRLYASSAARFADEMGLPRSISF